LENINCRKSIHSLVKSKSLLFFSFFLILLSSPFCTKEVKHPVETSEFSLDHYALGIYYQQIGEDSLAVEEFKDLLREEPNDPEILTDLAFSLSRMKKFKEAEKCAMAAVKNGARDENLFIILGNREKDRGRLEEAIEFYKKAISDTSNYFLVINLVQLLRDKDMIEEAASLLKVLKRRYPFDLRVHTQLGDLYGRMDEFDLAAHEFKEAIAIDSIYYPAILGLGILYEVTGEEDSAIYYYKKASSLNPENVNILNRILKYEIINGRWEEVEKYAQKAIEIQPTNTNARKQLAYSLYRLGNKEDSREQYLLLSGLVPKDASVHHFLGRLYYNDGEFEKAEDEFAESVRLNPDYVPNLEYLYILNIKKGDREKSLHFMEKLQKKGMKVEEVLFSAGTLFYREKDYKAAKLFFLESIEEKPDFVAPWYSLGFVYDKLGNPDSAEYSYRKVIELDSTNANALNALGYLLVENNIKLDEAEKLIKHALETDSLNGYYLDSLGWLYFKQGKYWEARDVLIKAKDLAEDPVIYDHLGDVYEKMGNSKKALKMWEKSLKLDPENEEIKKKIK
jgi:tetratricopeptide (TPR) repeat protein